MGTQKGEKRIAFAGVWYGELGWEICTWQPYLRKKSQECKKMYISTFPGMEPLYVEFHCPVEFIPHQIPERSDSWTSLKGTGFKDLVPEDVDWIIKPIKEYRVNGEHIRFGIEKQSVYKILLHARGIKKGAYKNYPREKWDQVVRLLGVANIASIGTREDLHIQGTVDLRGLPLGELTNVIASAEMVIGQSSGVMHLASVCGTRHVVWGDSKKHWTGETLEQRYSETWNPLHTSLVWIKCPNWDPNPELIVAGATARAADSRPGEEMLASLKKGSESGAHFIANAYVDAQDKLHVAWENKGINPEIVLKAIDQIKADAAQKMGIALESGQKEGGQGLW